MHAELPEGWSRVRLGDVARVDTGGTPSRQRSDFWDGGTIPWMASGEVHQRNVTSTKECVTDAGLRASNAKVFEPGTVMVALNGQGRTRGMTSRLAISAACNQSLAAIRPTEPHDSGFIFHNLDARYAELRALTGDDARLGLNLGLIRNLPLVLPSAIERPRIAEVLDSIDAAIEKTEAVMAQTEQLRATLLQELLTRGMPGRHTEWKHVVGVGSVPACWDVQRLGELCLPPMYGAGARGVAYDPSLPRYVRITDVTDAGTLRREDPKSADLSDFDEYLLESGDILFARSGATVGKTYLYDPLDGACVFAGYLIRFRPIATKLLSAYAFQFTRTTAYKRWVESTLRAGAQPNINATEYGSVRLPVPPIDEQHEIVSALGATGNVLRYDQAFLQDLRRLKACTANALLSGRVPVRTAEEVTV